jgi:hypothetical protein
LRTPGLFRSAFRWLFDGLTCQIIRLNFPIALDAANIAAFRFGRVSGYGEQSFNCFRKAKNLRSEPTDFGSRTQMRAMQSTVYDLGACRSVTMIEASYS